MKILSVLFYILKRGGSQDLRRIMFNKNNTKLFLFSLLLIKLSGVTNTGCLNFFNKLYLSAMDCGDKNILGLYV